MNTYYYNSYDYSPRQNSGFMSKSLEEGTVRRGELKPGLLYGSFRILECKPAWMGTSASMQGELVWQEMMPSETGLPVRRPLRVDNRGHNSRPYLRAPDQEKILCGS